MRPQGGCMLPFVQRPGGGRGAQNLWSARLDSAPLRRPAAEPPQGAVGCFREGTCRIYISTVVVKSGGEGTPREEPEVRVTASSRTAPPPTREPLGCHTWAAEPGLWSTAQRPSVAWQGQAGHGGGPGEVRAAREWSGRP